MNRRVGWLIAAGLFLALAPAIHAKTMYARTSTEVRSDKTLSAQVVARLNQGDAVAVLEQSGQHYRVSAGGKEGWVYFNKLADEKPEDITEALASASGSGMELTETQAGGALRGLSPAAEKYAASATDIPKWARQAVEDMQARRPAPKDLNEFARAGRLGEYGESQ